MKYDFDKIISRKNSNSIKWDYCDKIFGEKDVLPLWVADMDFLCPEFIIKKAKVDLNDGFTFGEPGVGFQRINIACPRRILEEALKQINEAVEIYN